MTDRPDVHSDLTEDVATRMREVLVQLTLLSNGSVARMDSNSGGGSARYYSDSIPQLGRFDAPHLYWSARWQAAEDDHARARVLDQAIDELRSITHSQADFTAVESDYDLCERIVSEFEGLTYREAAVRARTSESIVKRARRERGREEEYGRPPRDASGLPADERRRLVLSVERQYSSARAIAAALNLSYSTVLRDLARKA